MEEIKWVFKGILQAFDSTMPVTLMLASFILGMKLTKLKMLREFEVYKCAYGTVIELMTEIVQDERKIDENS